MTRDDFVSRVSGIRKKLLYIAGTKLPKDDCEDAVQSAILSAWEHLPQLKDEEAFEPWIVQILLNRCAQMYRKRKKTQAAIDALGQQESFAQDDGALREALDQMTPSERTLLLKHHEQGYSIRELSQQSGQSEDVLKMRLYRARNRLRVILILLLILLLLMSIAVGMGKMDIPWFLSNRRAEPTEVNTDYRSEAQISYDGQLLQAEITDAIWKIDTLSLLITYDFAGTDDDVLTVHNGNIGVDGERHDHIWIDDRILPIQQWAQGKAVCTYFLDGWQLGERYVWASEDYLPDGMGDAFFAELRFDQIAPEQYEMLLNNDGTLTLQNEVFVRDYATGETVEQGTLTVTVDAPGVQEWRTAYEEYDR